VRTDKATSTFKVAGKETSGGWWWLVVTGKRKMTQLVVAVLYKPTYSKKPVTDNQLATL
jgi:superoxide dismutase